MARFSEDFLADVDEYVWHVETAVENDVGRCGPASTIYNSTISAVCKDIMYPFVSGCNSVIFFHLNFVVNSMYHKYYMVHCMYPIPLILNYQYG